MFLSQKAMARGREPLRLMSPDDGTIPCGKQLYDGTATFPGLAASDDTGWGS